MITLKQGYPLELREERVIASEQVKFYRISLKNELILKKLYHLDLPLLSKLKSSKRLSLLSQCSLSTINFGSYVYRRGEAVESIFAVV